MKRSLESLLEELSTLNRVHMGLEKASMTRSYERGRHAQLVKQLDEHQQERNRIVGASP